ncbi:DUF378 domain-containing protein [Candidatus Peregrinibacteria bacterium CG11_big_fil_rev_8_21_14_0_20_46_8]|nr:MAG: DUF378 domain-containing protein [Candidatus Peregrinibacteria bacterium CG11_big_fil_rev_8_21_14_0_20_46_8]
MEGKSAWCWPSTILLLIGGLNWGLVGLGGFLDRNLNVVNLLLGQWPTVEWIIYLLVGVMAVKVLVMMLMGKKCC